MEKKVFWQGIAIMIGCIIGGGILALPYAVSKSGFWSSILLIIFLGLVMLFINLRIYEMNIAVKKPHQVVGLVERFLGKFGKYLMTIAMLLLGYGALIAYTIGSAKILSLMGGSELIWRLAFFIVGIFIVGKGIQVIGGSELFLEAIKLTIICIIVAFSFSDNFTPAVFSGFSLTGIGMVFGVSLFAYLGIVSIPEVYELIKEKKRLKKIIILGSIIPIIVYVLFISIVIAKTGNATTEVATIGLQKVFSPLIGVLINLFALLALITSFLAVSYSIYIMFFRDFKIKKTKSFLFAFVPPLIGMFFLDSFVRTIDLTGAIAGSTMVILLVLAHRQAGKRFKKIRKIPFFVDFILIGIFILGAIFTCL